jgi:hypothetical protein
VVALVEGDGLVGPV